jgi:predicted RNase H-like HicB family nuclease
MPVDRKLLERARRSPESLRFDEAVRLCRELGFEKVRQIRGHRIFRRPPALRPFNLQEGPRGRAKAYQVERMLRSGQDEQASSHAVLSDPPPPTCRVSWSVRDEECVATSEDASGLSGLGATPEDAIAELKRALAAWLDYLASAGNGVRA